MRYAVVRLDTGQIVSEFSDFADTLDELERADTALLIESFIDDDQDDISTADDVELAVLDRETDELATLDDSGAFVWSWYDPFGGRWHRKLEATG